MICGVNIGGKDTLEEWGLMLCNDLSIGAAVPRYRFIQIPEMSGALDLTEALTGSVPYDQRTITFTLFAVHDVIAGTRSPATEEHFQTVLARFSGFANGKRLHVYLPDNPDHYFVGRVSVGGKSGYNSGRVKVEVLADPYRLKDGETTLTVDDDDFFKTATPGALVTFDDGCDNIPMKSCVVSLVPEQDLNGYESPWPAGGGKNKCSILIGAESFGDNVNATHSNSNGTLVVNCTATNDSGVYSRGTGTLQPLIGGYSEPVTYSFDIKASAAGNVNVGYQGAGAKNVAATTSWQRVTINTTATGTNRAFVVYNKSGSALTVEVKDFMFQKGTIASANYEPYENICPISGHTGAELIRTGKNLLKKGNSTTSAGITFTVNEDGTVSATGTAAGTATLTITSPFLKAGTYTLSGCPNGGSGSTWEILMNKGGGSIYRDYGSGRTFTLAEDTTFLNWQIVVRTGQTVDSLMFAPMVELGSSASSYEPYKSITYSVTFSDQGTVYGGTVDFVSGELVVDRAIAILDGSSDESWVAWQGMYACQQVPITGSAQYAVDVDKFYCNSYKAIGMFTYTPSTISVGDYLLNSHDATNHIWNGNVSFKYDNGLNLANFKSVIADNPIQLVYQLKEPLTYQLTAQQVTSLLGKNNVWSNDGDISELVYMFTDEIIINNEGMPAIPTINASEAGPTVTLRGASHVLAAGDNRFSDFILQSGENVMQVEDPAGTLTIKYQEGML